MLNVQKSLNEQERIEIIHKLSKILQDLSSFNITEHEMNELLNSDNENSL